MCVSDIYFSQQNQAMFYPSTTSPVFTMLWNKTQCHFRKKKKSTPGWCDQVRYCYYREVDYFQNTTMYRSDSFQQSFNDHDLPYILSVYSYAEMSWEVSSCFPVR